MSAKRCGVGAVLCLVAALLVSACTSQGTAKPVSPAGSSGAPGEATETPAFVQVGSSMGSGETQSPELAMKHVRPLRGVTLATVNGQPITWTDFEPALRQAVMAIDRVNSVNWDDPAMQIRLGHLQNDVLKQVADRFLLIQMAEKAGIRVSDSEWEAAAEKQKAEIMGSGRYPSWDAYLAANAWSEQDYRRLVRESLIMSAFLARQQVDTQAEQVHLRHIALTDEAKAQEVVSRLKAGEDFLKLVAEYSEDTQTKENGGDLGWFVQETMFPALGEVAFALEPGEFSEAIATGSGYTIIQVIAREVRPVGASVLRQRQMQAIQAQLAEEKARADIRYLVDFTSTLIPSPSP